MRCLNHPEQAAAGSCMFCRNFFCEHCLETVGERKLCLDCLEAMAESSLEIPERSFLTTRQMAAGAMLLLLGLAVAAKSALDAIGLVQAFLFSRASGANLPAEAIYFSIEGAKVLVYLFSGYGILMTREWSYWLGLAVSAGTLLFSMYGLLSGPTRFGVLLFTASATALFLIAISWNDRNRS